MAKMLSQAPMGHFAFILLASLSLILVYLVSLAICPSPLSEVNYLDVGPGSAMRTAKEYPNNDRD